MTLIDRLRTGTHEQATGLLVEVQGVLKPEPSLSDQSTRADTLLWAEWKDWKANLDRLLAIGTPEACVGAAMMLKPEGWAYIIMDGFVELRHPTNPQKDVTGISASTGLALAAAIMEARNV